MKFRRSIVAIALTLVLSVVLSASQAAVNPVISPQYTYTSVIKSTLNVFGGTASASGSITPKPSNCRTFVKVNLQKKENGSWITIASWTESNESGVSSVRGSKALTKGITYRAYTIGKVYDSSGSLLETAYKASKTYSY